MAKTQPTLSPRTGTSSPSKPLADQLLEFLEPYQMRVQHSEDHILLIFPDFTAFEIDLTTSTFNSLFRKDVN